MVSFAKKIAEKDLVCSSCYSKIVFIKLNDVECDWGIHTIIQCPNCGELFSIDGPCPAFQNIVILEKSNNGFLSSQEISEYRSNTHSCNLE